MYLGSTVTPQLPYGSRGPSEEAWQTRSVVASFQPVRPPAGRERALHLRHCDLGLQKNYLFSPTNL